jgi:hypothetical protein
MSQNQEGTTATIYQFPARGRFAKAAPIDARLKVVDAPSIAFGSGWYHDDAIEAERTRKN